MLLLKITNQTFEITPKCKLINPAKNELGLVSKKHLENIIANIANTIKVNQW